MAAWWPKEKNFFLFPEYVIPQHKSHISVFSLVLFLAIYLSFLYVDVCVRAYVLQTHVGSYGVEEETGWP